MEENYTDAPEIEEHVRATVVTQNDIHKYRMPSSTNICTAETYSIQK